MPVADAKRSPHGPWQLLRDLGEASPWREEVEEYTGDSSRFHERHYNEFVSFLPYVQRFLYGEGRSRRRDGDSTGTDADSPMRIFRRHDIAALRVVAQPGAAPVTLDVVHCDLYFFFDVDVVLLNLEVCADHLSLAQAQELLYRFGRAYPAGWDAAGGALHCISSVGGWQLTAACWRAPRPSSARPSSRMSPNTARHALRCTGLTFCSRW